MCRYIIRLDDAADKMHIEKWNTMEKLLEQYKVKPLVGIIPECKDQMMDEYENDGAFWKKVRQWTDKGWCIAMHGYEHLYCTTHGGINPVNQKSEFAGLPLEEQKEKIRKGVEIFRQHGIEPKVFFAPSHTFDENTLVALKAESNIYIISDTIANKPYQKYGITFVPQQCGIARRLFLHTVTFCYHPNTMTTADFKKLEEFLKKNQKKFINFPVQVCSRKFSFFDFLLKKIYFMGRKSTFL